VRVRLLLAVVLTSCATARASHPFQGDGFSVTFPAEPAARRAHEGPLARAQIAWANHDDCRIEAAVFDFPRALDEGERARLLAKVERGLGARSDAHRVARRRLRDGVLDLTIALDDDRAGIWRIFYLGGTRMVQLSVVGPRDAIAAHSRELFASFSSD